MKWLIIVLILLALCGVSSALAYYFYNRHDLGEAETETQEVMLFAAFVVMTIFAIMLGMACAAFFIATLVDVLGG